MLKSTLKWVAYILIGIICTILSYYYFKADMGTDTSAYIIMTVLVAGCFIIPGYLYLIF